MNWAWAIGFASIGWPKLLGLAVFGQRAGQQEQAWSMGQQPMTLFFFSFLFFFLSFLFLLAAQPILFSSLFVLFCVFFLSADPCFSIRSLPFGFALGSSFFNFLLSFFLPSSWPRFYLQLNPCSACSSL
jgi:hypothetical protein